MLVSRVLIALVLALLVGACTVPTPEAFHERIGATIGWTETQLVARLGKPESVHVPDVNTANPGRVKFLTYSMYDVQVNPGMSVYYRGFSVGYPATSQLNSCTVIFQLEDGVVRSYQNFGNICLGRPRE